MYTWRTIPWLLRLALVVLAATGCNKVGSSGHGTTVRIFPDPETNHYRYKIELPPGISPPDVPFPMAGVADVDQGSDGDNRRLTITIQGQQYGSMWVQPEGLVKSTDRDTITAQDFFMHLPPPGTQPNIGSTWVNLPPNINRVLEYKGEGADTSFLEATNVVQGVSTVGTYSLATLATTGAQKIYHYNDTTGSVRAVKLIKAFDGTATLLGTSGGGWRVFSLVHNIPMGTDTLKFSLCLIGSTGVHGPIIQQARSSAGCDWAN